MAVRSRTEAFEGATPTSTTEEFIFWKAQHTPFLVSDCLRRCHCSDALDTPPPCAHTITLFLGWSSLRRLDYLHDYSGGNDPASIQLVETSTIQ